MVLTRQKIRLAFLSIFGAVMLGSLSACLDVPSDYQTGDMLESANVILIRENGDTSKTMQVPAGEKFKLVVKTTPKEFSDDLNVTWLKKGKELSSKSAYQYNGNNAIPDSTCLKDDAGNSYGMSFKIVQNTPPDFGKLVSPSNGDTLYGYKNSTYYFEWQASDVDNDTLTYLLEIDGTKYPTGIANSIYQGGLPFGKHELRIIVNDNFNNSDTSKAFTFYTQFKVEP